MKCLEKDRARRYETANGLAMDLQRNLNNEPVVARPPSGLYEFQRTVRRHKVGFAATGAVILALLVGLGISTWSLVKERQARRRAVTAEQNAETAATKSRQVAEFLKNMLRGIGPSVAKGRDTALLREILDRTAQSVGEDFKDQPEVEAELRTTLGSVYYFGLSEYANAESMLRAALSMRENRLGRHNLQVAGNLGILGMVRLNRNDANEGEAMEHKALAMFKRLLGSNHELTADTTLDLGVVLRQPGRFPEAESYVREALSVYRRLPGDMHTKTAAAANVSSGILERQNKPSESWSLYREAAEGGDSNAELALGGFTLPRRIMARPLSGSARLHSNSAGRLCGQGCLRWFTHRLPTLLGGTTTQTTAAIPGCRRQYTAGAGRI